MKHQGKRGLRLFENRAQKYLQDKKKAAGLLEQALGKADDNRGSISKAWHELQLLCSVVKDWISGDYKKMPTGSLLMILGAILYFVSPVDLVLDVIPMAGLIDDAAVIGLVVRQIRSDLQLYKHWKDSLPV